jgi:hypothetical protein
MKKKTLFAIVTGVLSCTIATLAKFEIDTLGYWLISLPIIVVLNVVYFNCAEDNAR